MLGLISAVAALTASASPFVRKPCADLQVAARAQCGTVSVAEDRSFPTGRQIALNVIIIPAAKPAKDRQALFDLDGGPGLADTKNASFYTTAGATYAASRDVVLIDQRGTGGSNPLDCPEFEKADRGLEPMFPAAAVRSCRVRMGRSADLTRYTSEDAVEDLEAVRRSLGYTKIDLFALSYGTTLALRYIADHGANVRSAVLLSAVPPSAMPPRYHAIAAQQALDQLMADCRADAKCRATYPRLRIDLANALRRIGSGRQIGGQVVMERLRTKLYSPNEARTVPWVIRRLSTGDTSILVPRDEGAGLKFYDGVYLTITCSESLPWFSQERAAAEARRTLFGDYRLARQREACARWPRAQVKPGFFAPVRSSVPTLFLSGGRDPVTPASWAKQASRYFPNSRQIVIPWAGHIVDGLTGLDTCFDPQILHFYATADPGAVDASCFKKMTPPPFKDAP